MAKLGIFFLFGAAVLLLATCAVQASEVAEQDQAEVGLRSMADMMRPKARKPECGKQTRNNARCPKGKCCSKYGYCGTHQYHCKVAYGCQQGCLNKSGKRKRRKNRKKPTKVVKKKKYPTKTIVKTISTPIPVCKNCNKMHRSKSQKNKDLAKAIKMAIKRGLIVPVKKSESTSSSTSVQAARSKREKRPSCELKGTCKPGSRRARGRRSRGRGGRGGRKGRKGRGGRGSSGSSGRGSGRKGRNGVHPHDDVHHHAVKGARHVTAVLKQAKKVARQLIRQARSKAKKMNAKIGRQKKTVYIKAAPIERKKKNSGGKVMTSTIQYNVDKPVNLLDPKGY